MKEKKKKTFNLVSSNQEVNSVLNNMKSNSKVYLKLITGLQLLGNFEGKAEIDFYDKIDDDKIFDNCKSNIDMANALDEIIDDINSEDTIELTTLSKFVLTRIGILISKKYIKYRNVKIKFYSDEGKTINEYSYNKEGGINNLSLTIYSAPNKPYKLKGW